MECGAIVEAAKMMGILDDKMADEAKALIVRIVSMLSKMCHKQTRA